MKNRNKKFKKKLKAKVYCFIILFVIFVSLFLYFKTDNKDKYTKAAGFCKGPADVILAIDRSASMSYDSKFSTAKSKSVNFIDKLFSIPPDASFSPYNYHQIGIAAFSTDVDVKLLSKNGDDVKNIINDSNGILGSSYPVGYRNSAEALNQSGLELINGLNYNFYATKTIIFLTDGPPRNMSLAKQKADIAKGNNIRIISIGLNLNKITDSDDKKDAEDFIKYIASSPSDCYYATDDAEAKLDDCNSISIDEDLDAALDSVYSSITASICDDSPPVVDISRIPSGTLFNVDKLKIISTAVDDIGFKSHTIRWSDDWYDPSSIKTITCPNLTGQTINCDTGEVGPFSAGKTINYRSFATDSNNNETSIAVPDPRSVTVADVNLNVGSLFRNKSNSIKAVISDPEKKANLSGFYISIDAPALEGLEIDKAAMSCSSSGSDWVCNYIFNPDCGWTDGITDGSANNINVDIYIYAKSDDVGTREIASSINNLLISYYEGKDWSGTCSDGINNDCDYDEFNDPIIDSEEMSCDVTGPSISISRNPSGNVYDNNSVTFTSTATDALTGNNGIRRHSIYYKKEGDSSWTTVFECYDESPIDGKCDGSGQDISSVSAVISPFGVSNIGKKIYYYSEAVDNSGNDNASNTPKDAYFIVKNKKCGNVNDMNPCTDNSGICCGGICNTSKAPSDYDDECVSVSGKCEGTAWVEDPANEGSDCDDGGNSDGCYVYNDGCEDRGYSCQSGYCTASVSNRNNDKCVGLDLYDYKCVSGLCSYLVSANDPKCDVILDTLSINAYNEDGVLISGDSGSSSGEVLDNKKVSFKSIVSDSSGIKKHDHKIYWRKVGESDWNKKKCAKCDAGETCECVKETGPFEAGDVIEFYAWAEDKNGNEKKTSVYSFTVRDHECYDIPGGNKTNLTLCNSNSGRCCGGVCDLSVGSNPYDPDCLVEACSGTNWVYVPGNNGNHCGEGGSCFDYYSGCVSGNICASGYCEPDPAGKKIDECNDGSGNYGNLFDNYGCSGGTCGLISGGLDCSLSENSDGDDINCNCDCNRYDVKEKVYSSLSFDGVDDYVTVPSSSSLNPEKITLEAWVYPTNFYYYGNIINKRYPAQYILRFYSNTGRIQGYVYSNGNWRYCTTSSSVAASLNQWNHVVQTYDGKVGRVYVNGIEGCSYSYVGNINTGNAALKIGSYYTASNRSERVEGMIDEVRIYNRALYPEEIKDHYNGIFSDDSGLVGYWNFDKGNGETVKDSSGNGNNGHLSNVDGKLHNMNNSDWVSGKYGDGLDFDGSNDYVDLGNSIGITGNQTIEMWIKPTDFNSRKNPYAKAFGGEGTITIETDGAVSYYYGTCGGNCSPYQGFKMTSNLQANEWAHLIIVRDLANMKLKWYKNGVLTDSGAALYSSAKVSSLSAYIGKGYVNNFKGIIDEVRIYNRALSDTEVEQHYKGAFDDNTGLIGYWDFNEGSGSTAYDSSENGPKWMKYHYNSNSGANGNVPENWQVCTDGKDNDCDGITDEYDTASAKCDGEVDGVSIEATAVDSDGILQTMSKPIDDDVYDIDVSKSSNNFTLFASSADDFGIKQTIIEWTTDNWGNKEEKACSGGVCKVCVKNAYAETGIAESGTIDNLTDNDKSWTNDEWQNWTIEIISGTGKGQTRNIVSNTSTKLTISPDWSVVPDSASEYQINKCSNESSGTAESSGSKSLTDNDKSWIDDEWEDGIIEIISGTGAGQIRTVKENSEDEIKVNSNWDTKPDSTSQYKLSKKGDIISSSSLIADKTFSYRLCVWDNNNNLNCADKYSIIILSSNSAPILDNLKVQNPNYCKEGLNYMLRWNFNDDDDLQASYDIQIKKGDKNFDTGVLIVDIKDRESSEPFYIINSDDFTSGEKMKYGKEVYYWRVRATDDRGGGYEKTSDWAVYNDSSDSDGDGNTETFTTPMYKYPEVKFSVEPNCVEESGNKCDFGENIKFSDNSAFVDCDSDSKCMNANIAKCDIANGQCKACDSNAQCSKFNSAGVNYSCVGGKCKTSDQCGNDDDCKSVSAARCYTDSETGVKSCEACNDDAQCANSKFGTSGVDYFCNNNGVCEDKERRKWYFYSFGGEPDDRNPIAVNNYIGLKSSISYVTLRIEDIFGNFCSTAKKIILGNKRYPKWNETHPNK